LKRVFFAILWAAGLPVAAAAQPGAAATNDARALLAETLRGASQEEDSGAPPTAAELMREVRARLPREPLTITGQLQVRRRKGIVAGTLNMDMFLHLGAEPARARYTIRDKEGNPLEQVTLTHVAAGAAGAETRLAYAKGNPLAPADLPDPFRAIRGTDISWVDLTLSFLWWEGGSITNKEHVIGRSCYVVDIPAPPRTAASPQTGSPYAGARVWVDEKLRMILQAEGYDATRAPIRRLWVHSIKKIDERWMIKDMEVESCPAEHRTRLTVLDVKEGGS
jgi:hypothetical protein